MSAVAVDGALLGALAATEEVFNDRWRPADVGGRDVLEVATGQVLGRIGLASPGQAWEATRRAALAQREWARTAPGEGARVLRRAGLLWEQHATELEDWLVRETGSIRPKAALELHTAANECYEAAALPTLSQGEVLATDEPRWSFARRRPAGVVSVIAPFNFPLILSIRSVAPALALGNAVVLKPDPRTAVSGGVALVRVFQEAGLPDGVLQLVHGGVDVGEAIVTAPDVRVVAFTGSTAAGRIVGELAGRHLKRAHLELGGNNALVVLPGADLDKAVSAGAFGSFMHQGQICMTTGRHLVHESLVEEYTALLASKATSLPVGDPAGDAVALGPLIDKVQLERVDSIVRESVAAGARLVAGGTHDGLFYRPTVLSGLDSRHRAWSEEIFGPVAPVRAYRDLDELIAAASDVEYGLSLGILGDVDQAMRVADAVPSGIVHINEQTVGDEAQAPFGGVRDSGTGSRVGGSAANLDAFTEVQWLTIRPDIAPYPF